MKNFSEKLKFISMHLLVLLFIAAPSFAVAAFDPVITGGTTGQQSLTTGIGGSNSMSVGNTSGISIYGSGSSAGSSGKFDNPLGSNTSLAGLLEKILNVVIQIGAVVVVFFYIYAGFKYVVARGDEGEIKKATQTLTWTTVGAMVILGAQVISTAIQGTVSQISSGK